MLGVIGVRGELGIDAAKSLTISFGTRTARLHPGYGHLIIKTSVRFSLKMFFSSTSCVVGLSQKLPSSKHKIVWHLPFDERMTFDKSLYIVLQILLGDVGFDDAFDDVNGDEFRALKSGTLNVMRVAFFDFHR